MLTDSIVQKAKPRAKLYSLSDRRGKGLCLLVYPNGGKYWRYRYFIDGKAKMFSLGTYPDISLDEARKRLAEARTLKATGIDPSKQKQELKRESSIHNANTFEKVAREWYGKQEWSESHARDVLRRLEANLFPFLGSRPIREIKAPELLTVLQKIEERGAVDIAKRCCQMTGQVFRYAVATGRTEYDVTTNLRGALQTRASTHFNFVKPCELPEFMTKLKGYNGDALTKLAIRFLILTFVRTKELRGARWEEIHWRNQLWTVPKERMKKKREHIVPLSRQTMDVLAQIKKISGHTPFLFPGTNNPKKVMSENTILYAIYRMGYHSRATGHGFRRTASTALNDMAFNRDYIEMQLAHAERSKSRGPYNAALYLPQREFMMQHWADFLDAVSQENSIVTTWDFRVSENAKVAA
jgi:integrase